MDNHMLRAAGYAFVYGVSRFVTPYARFATPITRFVICHPENTMLIMICGTPTILLKTLSCMLFWDKHNSLSCPIGKKADIIDRH